MPGDRYHRSAGGANRSATVISAEGSSGRAVSMFAAISRLPSDPLEAAWTDIGMPRRSVPRSSPAIQQAAGHMSTPWKWL